MTTIKAHNLRKLPMSGNWLTDWIFKQFVVFLRKKTLKVRRKRYLVDPAASRREGLYGLLDDELDPAGRHLCILINSSRTKHPSRTHEAHTLIHELAHLTFWRTGERFICQMEKMLIRRFTPQQMRYLKSFLPCYEIKRYPRLAMLRPLARLAEASRGRTVVRTKRATKRRKKV